MIKPGPKEPQDAYEAVFTSLAHLVRRRILMTVFFQGGTMTAGEIAAMFEQAWPTTTRHLQSLVAAKLLQHSREGRASVYKLNSKRLELARDWIDCFVKK